MSDHGATSPRPFLLTVEEAAQHLRIGRTLMFGLIKTGAIKSVKVGSLRRIRPADLKAYTESLQVEDQSPNRAA